MQKKLIALAVAAITSGAAFAQTNVVISGNMDLSISSFRVQNSVTAAADLPGTAGRTVTTNTMGLHNNASTSNVTLTVTEDLGNGLKVKAYIETDPAFGSTAGSVFANAPNWLELSGNFGALSLGYINNFALTAATTAQPFGTALGGGYSGTFGRLDGNNNIGASAAYTALGHIAATGSSGVRDIRTDRTLQYVTPNLNGFSGGFQYAAKNSGAVGNTLGVFQLGLQYANGPIKVAYANSRLAGDNVSVIAVGGTGNTLTHNLLGANFTFGAATIYGGYTSSSDTARSRDSRSFNVALKYAFTNAISGMVNVLRVNDLTAVLPGGQDRSLAGLGLDYAMSKRTTAYARYEGGDNDKSSSTALLANGANRGNFNRLAVGMRHSF